MPELPEVETITTRLRPFVVGKIIHHVDLLHPRPLLGNVNLLTNLTIIDVTRRAKTIRIHLNQDQNLLIHLKMTGQLIYVDEQHKVGGGHPTDDWVLNLPSKHTRLAFIFNDQSKLFFNDQRLFGWVKIIDSPTLADQFAKLPPDVIDPEFTLEYFQNILSRKRVPIKQVIMDHTLLGGVGNIYACDALNMAKISPWRPANSLTKQEQQILHQSLIDVIQTGITMGGATTDGKYVDISGFAGKYQTVSRVYDRIGLSCRNCGAIIQKQKLAGRGTYYCPNCQK